MVKKISHTLKSLPGFLAGAAIIFDMGATAYPSVHSQDPDIADYKALADDWAKVGEDLSFALNKFGENHHLE